MPRARLLPIIIFLLLLICGCTAPPDTAMVTGVIDGDTIIIEGGYRLRYIGIDTPEIDGLEPFAMEALEANRRLVEGKIVRLERDISQTDKYDRLLRYVYVDGMMVNAELVRLGLAEAKAYPPDTKYQEKLEKAEREAKQAGRGIWAK
jgi:micrococcal nuclease